MWFPNSQTVACATGGSVAGILSVQLHLVAPSMDHVWHEWTEVRENSGHGGQRLLGRNWTPVPWTTPCTPTPGAGQRVVSYEKSEPLMWAHNGSWTVRSRYGWREFIPPYGYGDPQYAEVSITVDFDNLLLHPYADNPVVLAWDPDDPAKCQTTVRMALTDAQVNTGAVQLQVYRLDDPAQERAPLRVVEVPVSVPSALVEITWDGRDEWGNVMERGVYAYDLVTWDDTLAPESPDRDKKTSNYLFIDAATDEQGNPILDAEYAGYDDNGTPEDEGDDNYLYYIRQYKLREAMVPLDNDGDMWENEDWVDGIDADGDGFTDEDPEDYQPLRGASEGWIRLYYVDELEEKAEWAIPDLFCWEHGWEDGLRTSAEGLQHTVLLAVPAALMEKSGEYRFVISAKDSHADREKGHRQKWALKRNMVASVATQVNFDFDYAYYPAYNPYSTHTSTPYPVPNPQDGDTWFQLPFYQLNGNQTGWVQISQACTNAAAAQQGAGYKAGPLGGTKTNGSRSNAIDVLKKKVALFSFNGHANSPGNQGGMAFYRSGVWELLLGAGNDTPPTGADYAYLRNELSDNQLETLLFGLVLGCHVSQNPEGSVLYEMINKGAACDAGFKVTVYTPPIIAFHVYFWDLAMGNKNSQWLATADRTVHTVKAAAEKACDKTRDACITQGIDPSRIPKIGDFKIYSRPGVDEDNLKLVPARDGRKP